METIKTIEKAKINVSTPIISVVVPAYNEERFLGACLDSLLSQDFSYGYEIIVVDNNSTDETSKIAISKGVRLITETKRGVCAARNAGTLAAHGEIIVSTDADSTFAPNWLTKIYETFEQDQKVVAVTGPVIFVQAPRWASLGFKILFWGVSQHFYRTGKVKYISACNTAFKKSSWTGYNTNLTQGGDEIDLLKQLEKQGPIVYINNPVQTSSRRLHKGFLYNLLVTFLAYYIFDYFVGRKINRSLLGSYEAIRVEKPKVSPLPKMLTAAALLILGLTYTSHNAKAASLMRRTGHRLAHVEDRVEQQWPHRSY
jgi:glycosyltransferase involved in cell wall biosynthesis